MFPIYGTLIIVINIDHISYEEKQHFLGHRSTLLCALGFVVCGGSSLDSIAKDCWVFPLIEKGFPRITYCVLVHGYSSCDLGY